jgi:MOSC domain-containing protein YiiM
MKIVSVNVGLPRQVVWKDTPVWTAIFKEPVQGPVKVSPLNLDGDRQADLTVHGGVHKAVYGYPVEHYEYWSKELPDVSFGWGKFGENLTIDGLSEDTLHIGDRLRIGSAVLMVSQPRMPCFKLAIRFERDDMIKRFLNSRRSGFYFSVVEEGEICAGSKIEILSRDANRVKVRDLLRMYIGETQEPDLVNRAMNVDALPQSWKNKLAQKNGLGSYS